MFLSGAAGQSRRKRADFSRCLFASFGYGHGHIHRVLCISFDALPEVATEAWHGSRRVSRGGRNYRKNALEQSLR